MRRTSFLCGAVFTALFAALPAPLFAQSPLGARIDAIVDDGPLARAHWGIHVVDAATGEELYARNADRLFVPASNLKMVVAAAGAHYLGGEFRWSTRAYATGPITQGELQGDLVLYGTGDPSISGRWQDDMRSIVGAWADSLRAAGVRSITGTVVADQSHWDDQLLSHDWEIYDVLWWYAAPVAPLGFNDNAIDFRIAPGEPGSPARVTWQPSEADFTFVNRSRTTAAGSRATFDLDRVAGTDTIFAYGELPADASARTEYFAIDDPGRYLATITRAALERAGIRVAGGPVRVVTTPDASPVAGAQLLFEHRSAPLRETIAPILLTSQNWFAEQLLKTLGREVNGTGSWRAGLDAAADFLTDVVGVDSGAFVLRDASGLSASNLITPRALTKLYGHAHRDARLRAVLESGTAVSGRSGSLRNRLTDLDGRVAAKTGSIRHVDALSGVLRTDDGREVVFAIVANATGTAGSRVRSAIDAVVRSIATH